MGPFCLSVISTFSRGGGIERGEGHVGNIDVCGGVGA